MFTAAHQDGFQLTDMAPSFDFQLWLCIKSLLLPVDEAEAPSSIEAVSSFWLSLLVLIFIFSVRCWFLLQAFGFGKETIIFDF